MLFNYYTVRSDLYTDSFAQWEEIEIFKYIINLAQPSLLHSLAMHMLSLQLLSILSKFHILPTWWVLQFSLELIRHKKNSKI